jgi:PAS domain S-box-containing protein/putative nucleotidyltransferase with HDIG domain
MKPKLRALIIEDSEDDALLAARELRRGDYDVFTQRVETLAALREALETQTWDIILSDFSLPQLNGLDALKLLNQSGLDVPFILISGTVGEDIAVAAMKSGASDYLMKGQLARLAPAVQRELREAEMRRERRRARVSLRESEERLRLALDAAGMGTWDMNAQTLAVTWSGKVDELFGMRSGEFARTYEAYLALMPDADRVVVRQLVAEFWQDQRESAMFEHRISWPDGSTHWLEVHAQLYCDETGNALRVAGTLADITARKQSEASLQRYAARMEILHEIDRAILAAQSAEEITAAALSRIRRLVSCLRAIVVQMDLQAQEGVVLMVSAENDTPLKVGSRVPFGIMSEQTWTHMRQRQPEIIDDLSQLPALSLNDQALLAEGVRTCVRIPLSFHDELIGVLSLLDTKPRAFTAEDIEIAAEVANQLAIALQQARLRADTAEALRREQQLNEITRTISSALDLPTVLQTITRLTAELIGVEVSVISLLEGNGQYLAPLYAHNLPLGVNPRRQARDEGVSWRVIDQRAAIIVNHYPTHPQAIPDLIAAGVQSVLHAPILAGETVLGVLGLYYTTAGRRFSDRDRALVESIGRQAGIAIQNARLFETEQHRVALLTALHEISLDIGAELNLAELLQTILERATRLLKVNTGGFYLLRPESQQLELAAASGTDYKGLRLRVGEGVAGQVAQTGDPLIVADYAQWPQRAEVFADSTFHAVVGVPVKWQQQVRGVIVLEDARPNRFTSDDVSIVRLLADQAAVAIQNAQLFEATRRQLSELTLLQASAMAGAISEDEDRLIETTTRIVSTSLFPDMCGVWLLDESAGILRLHSSQRGLRGDIQPLTIPLGKGITGAVAERRQAWRVPDVRWEPSYIVSHPDMRSELCVPMKAGDQLIGVFNVESAKVDMFSEADERLLSTLAGQLATAIARIRAAAEVRKLNAELIAAYDATLEGWSHALDLRDKDTEGHTRRVTEMALRLAEAMGLPEVALQIVRRGALLHDIGKMGVPDSILHKPGPLTDEEWIVMRRHPQHAYDMLAAIHYLEAALDIPYCHHEKWDGTGYPRGLRGEEIPLAARLFAVVDVWDALSFDRPYRAAWPAPRVRDYIRSRAGTHFDPRVVEVFLQLIP